MYKRMISEFAYVDAMIDDTPVIDFEYRKGISDVRTILERTKRAQVFVSYLNGYWETIDDRSTIVFDWEARCRDLASDIERAEGRAVAAASKRTYEL